MSGTRARAAAGLQKGSIMIEVMVALLMLAVLMVSLTGAVLAAVHLADDVRQDAGRLSDDFLSQGVAEHWSWGTHIVEAWWRAGPRLNLRPHQREDLPVTVGVWVGGWFLGEKSAGVDGLVCIEAPMFTAYAGSEVVARARAGGGPWGPPWRSLVPEAAGELAVAAAPAAPSGEVGQVVAHAPAAGNPEFTTSWGERSTGADPPGLPFVMSVPFSGSAELGLDRSNQSWLMDLGRELDVYF